MQGSWDKRYTEMEGVYGREPSPFWVQELQQCSGSTILLPCEGEGRNALWAAQEGWNVDAFDSSEVGMATCKKWCKAAGVAHRVSTHTADALSFQGTPDGYDVVGLFYAHMPAPIRQQFHRRAAGWLKPGGTLILEGFNPNQIGLGSGGPRDREMLFSADQLQDDFKDLKIEQVQTVQTHLNEGPFHQGKAEIIRLIGKAVNG